MPEPESPPAPPRPVRRASVFAHLGLFGLEPLDPALADRFAFVVEMPAWEGLAEADQLAIIRAEDAGVPVEAAQALERLLSQVGHALP